MGRKRERMEVKRERERPSRQMPLSFYFFLNFPLAACLKYRLKSLGVWLPMSLILEDTI